MRVVWKDSQSYGRVNKEMVYREIKITDYKDGYVIDIAGDNNIYFPRECALNAIDLHLGGKRRNHFEPLRLAKGLNVIGKVDEVS